MEKLLLHRQQQVLTTLISTLPHLMQRWRVFNTSLTPSKASAVEVTQMHVTGASMVRIVPLVAPARAVAFAMMAGLDPGAVFAFLAMLVVSVMDAPLSILAQLAVPVRCVASTAYAETVWMGMEPVNASTTTQARLAVIA
mmetsp:Transcript_19638/g.50311  ORF Transcript_19638/g.50311 Transcript_19638/m.50311 type:complete len:140 (-) Transcript_19638:1775-2194(-)